MDDKPRRIRTRVLVTDQLSENTIDRHEPRGKNLAAPKAHKLKWAKKASPWVFALSPEPRER
ncbi:hypothetical protein L484_000191 [Morus notabilis]|uniref:Uncharacterized protein n=1 Tax=Morus notabilis TaxID=981085 RepID=W9RFL6_9ROSA|nr:hypothetical protein L484_012867 [Morus notabilis]EXC39505.1 hypothetical protein L484_000191 [Morus notabilis]